VQGVVPRRALVPTEARRPPPPLAGEGLIGQSRPWRRVLRLVRRVAPSTCSVVLLGETGTGKERLARAIHATSRRAHGPFVAINCGAIPRDLLGTELFGHIRGAFTGAMRNHDGAFVRAHRGTLFLDEVADMSPDMQVAILRTLEDHTVMPLGCQRPRDVDVRVLCATNKDLHAEVAANRFREDLYHRLDVVEIRLPPLRERGADVALLARHLLSGYPERRTLHVDALRVLLRYPWPGNVRELDNVLRAAALLTDGPEITPETLERILAGRRAATERRAAPRQDGPRHRGLLDALRDEWRSAADLAASLSISARTVNRDLSRLVANGVVECFGEARARRYRLACRDSSRLRTRGPNRG
jgi:DNA-binding NtrC family response regulator